MRRTNNKTRQAMLMLCLATLLITTWSTSSAEKAATTEATESNQPHFPMVTPPDAFNELTTLVGSWQGMQDSPEGARPVEVVYEMTAAGTALVETLFPGTPHEMVSVYHGDGQNVLMTHYCAMGNQPRMQLQKSEDPKKMKFVCIDGTSMKSENDAHMHQMEMTRIDEDSIEHVWTSYANGEPNHVAQFTLKRVK